MIDHVSIPVSDLQSAGRFYDAVLGVLGMRRLDDRPATIGYGKRYSEFWLNARPGLVPAPAGSGLHICLRARSTDLVDAFHAAALKAGGGDDGAPGPRPHFGTGYYAAFITDPDGNRIEVVTFRDAGAGDTGDDG
ncbi:MAG: VOC family protein [Pseudomonadota bacterium]|nr:VOC family protein [Pseudomonadota bacterium]